MNAIATHVVAHGGLEVMVVQLQGDIDMANADHLLAEISAAVPNTVGALVVDTSDVTYLDSNGVRLLFELARAMQRRRKPFLLVVPPRSYHRKVLLITELHKVVSVAESMDEALGKITSTEPEYDDG